jgi:hypothetical protein
MGENEKDPSFPPKGKAREAKRLNPGVEAAIASAVHDAISKSDDGRKMDAELEALENEAGEHQIVLRRLEDAVGAGHARSMAAVVHRLKTFGRNGSSTAFPSSETKDLARVEGMLASARAAEERARQRHAQMRSATAALVIDIVRSASPPASGRPPPDWPMSPRDARALASALHPVARRLAVLRSRAKKAYVSTLAARKAALEPEVRASKFNTFQKLWAAATSDDDATQREAFADQGLAVVAAVVQEARTARAERRAAVSDVAGWLAARASAHAHHDARRGFDDMYATFMARNDAIDHDGHDGAQAAEERTRARRTYERAVNDAYGPGSSLSAADAADPRRAIQRATKAAIDERRARLAGSGPIDARAPAFQDFIDRIMDRSLAPSFVHMPPDPQGKSVKQRLLEMARSTGPQGFDACREIAAGRGRITAAFPLDANQAVAYAMAQLRAAGRIDTPGLLCLHSTGAGKTAITAGVILAFWDTRTLKPPGAPPTRERDGRRVPILVVSTKANQDDNNPEKLAEQVIRFYAGDFRDASGERIFAHDEFVRRAAAAAGGDASDAAYKAHVTRLIAARLEEGMRGLESPRWRASAKRKGLEKLLHRFATFSNDLANSLDPSGNSPALAGDERLRRLVAEARAKQARKSENIPDPWWLLSRPIGEGGGKPEPAKGASRALRERAAQASKSGKRAGPPSDLLEDLVVVVDEVQYLATPEFGTEFSEDRCRLAHAVLTKGRDRASTWMVGLTATPGETRADLATIMNAIAGEEGAFSADMLAAAHDRLPQAGAPGAADWAPPASGTSAEARFFARARGLVSYADVTGNAAKFASVCVKLHCSGVDVRSPYGRALLQKVRPIAECDARYFDGEPWAVRLHQAAAERRRAAADAKRKAQQEAWQKAYERLKEEYDEKVEKAKKKGGNGWKKIPRPAQPPQVAAAEPKALVRCQDYLDKPHKVVFGIGKLRRAFFKQLHENNSFVRVTPKDGVPSTGADFRVPNPVHAHASSDGNGAMAPRRAAAPAFLGAAPAGPGRGRSRGPANGENNAEEDEEEDGFDDEEENVNLDLNDVNDDDDLPQSRAERARALANRALNDAFGVGHPRGSSAADEGAGRGALPPGAEKGVTWFPVRDETGVFAYLASPKLVKMVDSIASVKGKHYVYTSSRQTAAVVAFLLNCRGMRLFHPAAAVDDKDTDPPRYALLNMVKVSRQPLRDAVLGEGGLATKDYDVRKVRAAFDQPENDAGGRIRVVIATDKKFAGVDLKGVQHLHLVDTMLNYKDLIQFLGRGPRNCSHGHLTRSKRKVTLNLYWLTQKGVRDEQNAHGSRCARGFLTDCRFWVLSRSEYDRNWGKRTNELLQRVSIDYKVFRDNFHANAARVDAALASVRCGKGTCTFDRAPAAGGASGADGDAWSLPAARAARVAALDASRKVRRELRATRTRAAGGGHRDGPGNGGAGKDASRIVFAARPDADVLMRTLRATRKERRALRAASAAAAAAAKGRRMPREPAKVQKTPPPNAANEPATTLRPAPPPRGTLLKILDATRKRRRAKAANAAAEKKKP